MDAPSSLPFPMSLIVPALPVPFELLVGNPFIVPTMPVPVVLSVVSSPTWVYVKIETRHIVVITPIPVIVMRPIPTTFPQAPPPAVPKIQVCVYLRSGVHVVRIRQRYHIRRRLGGEGRRQGSRRFIASRRSRLRCWTCRRLRLLLSGRSRLRCWSCRWLLRFL